MYIESQTVVMLGYNGFISKMSDFSSAGNHKDLLETVVDFSLNKTNGEDNSTTFYSDAKIKEIVRIACLIPLKKTIYKTRRIIFRPENDEVRISLHEIIKKNSEEEDFKKRKFRFYVKEVSLNDSFLSQCQKYLLNRISNNDLIKSIPHVKSNGLELL